MFGNVEYSLGPVAKEAVWDGVIQADSMWCYADQKSYQSVIGNVYSDYQKYVDMANKLKSWVCQEFEDQKQYDAFANAVSLEESRKEEVVSFE